MNRGSGYSRPYSFGNLSYCKEDPSYLGYENGNAVCRLCNDSLVIPRIEEGLVKHTQALAAFIRLHYFCHRVARSRE